MALSCDFGVLPGVCSAGACEDAMLCATVDCDDQNECTEDACDPMDGACGYTDVIDGLSCDFGVLPGVCNAGACEDAMLCVTVDCDDGNQCTENDCDPMDGSCDYTPAPNGTLCNLGGSYAECSNGTCTTAACATNGLCFSCPSESDASCDCDLDEVCMSSGCETFGGDPIMTMLARTRRGVHRR